MNFRLDLGYVLIFAAYVGFFAGLIPLAYLDRAWVPLAADVVLLGFAIGMLRTARADYYAAKARLG